MTKPPVQLGVVKKLLIDVYNRRFNDIINGNPYQQGYAISTTTVEVLTSVMGTKGIDKLGKFSKLSKVAKARLASPIPKLNIGGSSSFWPVTLGNGLYPVQDVLSIYQERNLFNRYLGLAKEAGNVFGFGFNLGPKLALVDGLPSETASHFASDAANKSNSLYAAAKNTGGISSSTNATKMLGANGPQISSKTVWRNKNSKYERIDVENPNPGERAGQVHYHDENNNKYVYDFEKNVFKYDGSDELAPPAIQKSVKIKRLRWGLIKD